MIRRIRGVALITVMLVVALVAIIATQMLAKLQLHVQRSTNIESNQQAYWYALGAEVLAKRVLKTVVEDESNKIHLGQLWAQGANTYPVDFGEISGEITDLHACFNLNALRENSRADNPQQKSVARASFEALIVALDIEGIGEFEAEYMADALVDWLDPDSAIISAGGAEDNDYAAKEFPYLPANHYLASVNELRVIEHFTVPVINALKPFVCVLPKSNAHQININTISPEQPQLLQALLSIGREQAEQALAARDSQGFDNKDDFFNLSEVNGLNITNEQKQQFVVNSEYFKLKARASFNNSFFYLNSIIQVVNSNQINVISRTIGRD